MKAITKKLYRYSPYQLKLARSLKNHKAYVPPKIVQVEITNLCNLKCIMCDRWKWAKEDTSTSDSLSTQMLFNLFNEFADIGVNRILLTGGEPLIRADIAPLVRHISDLKMAITIFTNGTLMDREKAQALAAANAVVFFSVDGVSGTHDKIRGVPGTFDAALRGIQNLVQAKKEGHFKGSVIINFTIQKSNITDVEPIFNVADKVGVDLVTYNVVHGKPEMVPDEHDLKMLQNVFLKLKKLAASSTAQIVVGDIVQALIEGRIPLNDVKAGLPSLSLFRNAPIPCFAVYTTSFVDSFGRVFPCCFCYLDNFSFSKFEKERRRFQMGSALETSFSKIWYGEAYDEFRANTDPVDMNALSFFCGQCHNYFAFKKSFGSLPFYRKSKAIDSPS